VGKGGAGGFWTIGITLTVSPCVNHMEEGERGGGQKRGGRGTEKGTLGQKKNDLTVTQVLPVGGGRQENLGVWKNGAPGLG